MSLFIGTNSNTSRILSYKNVVFFTSLWRFTSKTRLSLSLCYLPITLCHCQRSASFLLQWCVEPPPPIPLLLPHAPTLPLIRVIENSPASPPPHHHHHLLTHTHTHTRASLPSSPAAPPQPHESPDIWSTYTPSLYPPITSKPLAFSGITSESL